jgi:hypothetical protein
LLGKSLFDNKKIEKMNGQEQQKFARLDEGDLGGNGAVKS